jgi:uncharacterized membrane protein
MSKLIQRYHNFRAIHKLLLCLAITGVASIVFFMIGLEDINNILISWCVFSACMIGLNWATFLITEDHECGNCARAQDESRPVTFAIVVLSVCISFLGIVFVLWDIRPDIEHKGLLKIFSLVGVLLSWTLLHTIFTLHYAHLHYIASKQPEIDLDKLNFPDNIDPDYLDLAYFSFTIGMTFQVSDVTISSRRIRRFVLLHSLISFIFNVIIIALTITMLSGILTKPSVVK